MSFKLKWIENFNTKECLSFMIVGSAPECSQITKQVKICLDERYKHKKSLVHCCEDLEDLVDEVDILIDFIVILIDIQHERTSERHVMNTIKGIDPRYILNSRLIFVTLMSYSTNLNRDMLKFFKELSKKYDSIWLNGSTEEPEFVNDISQSITQYASYIFQKQFVNIYTNST